MLNTTLLAGFVLASLVVLLVPGPGVLYVVARSVTQGRTAGLVSVLGLSTGALVHVAAATIGLSTILMTSATAFGIVKLIGAAYLIYLGISALLSREPAADAPSVRPKALRRLFTDGVLISVFNPKVAVFFLAFLPQFADPAIGSVTAQVFLLGLIYVGLAVVTDGGYALLAARLGAAMKRRVLHSRPARYVNGGIYIGLGITAALADRRT